MRYDRLLCHAAVVVTVFFWGVVAAVLIAFGVSLIR